MVVRDSRLLGRLELTPKVDFRFADAMSYQRLAVDGKELLACKISDDVELHRV